MLQGDEEYESMICSILLFNALAEVVEHLLLRGEELLVIRNDIVIGLLRYELQLIVFLA